MERTIVRVGGKFVDVRKRCLKVIMDFGRRQGIGEEDDEGKRRVCMRHSTTTKKREREVKET